MLSLMGALGFTIVTSGVIGLSVCQACNFHQIIGWGGGARRTESEFYYFTIS